MVRSGTQRGATLKRVQGFAALNTGSRPFCFVEKYLSKISFYKISNLFFCIWFLSVLTFVTIIEIGLISTHGQLDFSLGPGRKLFFPFIAAFLIGVVTFSGGIVVAIISLFYKTKGYWPRIPNRYFFVFSTVLIFYFFFRLASIQFPQSQFKVDSSNYLSAPYFDPNPIIRCEYSSNCGGAIPLRLSVCKNSTCCEITKGNWATMSKAECAEKQEINKVNTAQINTVSNNVKKCGPFPNSNVTLWLNSYDCANYIDCQFQDGWYPMAKNDCNNKPTNAKKDYAIFLSLSQLGNIGAQDNNTATNQKQNGEIKVHCSYNGGSDYNYDFGDLTWDECTAKSNAYWASKRMAIPTYSFPTYPVYQSGQTSNNTTKTIDEAACRRQYQAETQAANSLGGSARNAAIEIATQSLNRCLSTGVVEVHTIQYPPSPTKVDSGYYGGKY